MVSRIQEKYNLLETSKLFRSMPNKLVLISLQRKAKYLTIMCRDLICKNKCLLLTVITVDYYRCIILHLNLLKYAFRDFSVLKLGRLSIILFKIVSLNYRKLLILNWF